MAKSNRILNDQYIEQVEHFQLSASELLQLATNRVLHRTLVVVNVVGGGGGGGFSHALPHNMLLISRRVCSLEFLSVAVLEVRSPSAATDPILYDWLIYNFTSCYDRGGGGGWRTCCE